MNLTWYGPTDLERAYYVGNDMSAVRLWVRTTVGPQLTVDVLADGVSIFPANRKPLLIGDRTEDVFDGLDFATDRIRAGTVLTLLLTGGRSGTSVQLDLE